MLPNDDNRRETRKNLGDKNGKLNIFQYLLIVFFAAIIAPVMIQIPNLLIGTEYEWITNEIKNSSFWKVIYGVVFCIIFFLICGCFISLYEYIKGK